MRILLVDDHAFLRAGLMGALREEYPGATFGEAANHPKALALLQEESWDLALLDINIPGRSGLEILSEVRRLHPELPVLMLSAYPEEEFAIRSFKMGASGYLTKSSAPDELIAAVRKLRAGGKYVTAKLAEALAAVVGGELRQLPHDALSPRELQVMKYIARGSTIKEIAAELGLSDKTISTYRGRIAEKLNLSSNVELTRYAMKHQLVD